MFDILTVTNHLETTLDERAGWNIYLWHILRCQRGVYLLSAGCFGGFTSTPSHKVLYSLETLVNHVKKVLCALRVLYLCELSDLSTLEIPRALHPLMQKDACASDEWTALESVTSPFLPKGNNKCCILFIQTGPSSMTSTCVSNNCKR